MNDEELFEKIMNKELTICETCDNIFGYIRQKVFCDECKRERKKAYYEENREEILAYKRKYREENREKLKAYARNYCKENREKLNADARNYRKENHEKINARRRARCRANKEK